MTVRLVAQEEPLPGYRLLERLGRGGFGEVWKVEAPGGLLKAMKFVFGDLDASDDESSRPAEQELKALKRVQAIRHPYVLSLERYDILEGQLIIVMELADRNLWDRFRECRSQGLPGIPRDELLRYMEETAEALDLMNNYYQIQHLDIKPQNLFLVFNHVKVGDFGLAKLLEGVRATVTGGVTPVYAAPETFEGWVSRYSDQYSLAIVYQELLTGSRPFNGTNTRQLLMQHLNGAPDLSALTPDERPIIARALAKKPDERWTSCAELVRALAQTGYTAAPAGGSAAVPFPAPRGGSGVIPVPTPAGDSAPPTRVQQGTDPLKPPAQTPPPPSPVGVPRRGLNGAGAAPGVTPVPGLVTVGPAGQVVPRLVTPSATGNSHPAVTLQRPQVFQTGRMSAHGLAPPEKTGDGALFPALVVAVGNVGRVVVEQMRRVIRDRYGAPDAVPTVRFLYIDTDPEAAAELGGPQDGTAALTGREFVHARLNRPAHYLQRDGLPPLEQWMPPGSLYKLPRNPASADGVRAFGRLALIDNYRLVAQRLRQEIETFLTDDLLTAADNVTRLGVRTNRPRAYVVAGLAGGTGGGMFVDLAYLIRQELRAVGYARPEVVGLFLVPPADKAAQRGVALGNTFAALTELYHWQAGRTRYQTTFDKAEPPVADGDPPFARAGVLLLPRAVDPRRRAAVAGLAARALFNEVLTPAGRVTDDVREVYRAAFPTGHPTCQTFGLFRLSWPRPELLTAATRRFAQRLLQRWTAKDAAHLREPIAAWLEKQWADRKLGIEPVVDGFNAAARDAVREDPEKVFDAFIDPLRTRTPSSTKFDQTAACSVLDQILKLVGKPPSEDDQTAGALHAPLAAHYDAVARAAEVHLATMAVSFIEQPQYRLAGAEEAVRQIGDKLKLHVDALEPLRRDLDRDVRHTYARLFQAIGNMTGGWKGSHTAEVLDLLRNYPRKRLRLHVLDFTLSVYRKLLGNVPEYLREINYCRAALGDMHAALAKADGPVSESVGPGKLILPEGCQTLDDAADRFLAGLNPADILAFDKAMQKDTQRKFRALAAVCLKPAEKGAAFRTMLLTRARAFLDSRLETVDPAEVFFRNRTGTEADYQLITEAFEEAGPEVTGLSGVAQDEITVVGAPPGPGGDRFRLVVAQALPTVEFESAPLPDDIAFYREYPRLDLADLPHLGDHARDAYLGLSTADHPPHSRADVNWQPAGLP